MRGFVDRFKTNPIIREVALDLTRNLPQKDFKGEINNLFRFVQNNIRYVRDVVDVETVQTPIKTLEYSQGDCDDKATLLGALLESLGHPTRFHAMGFERGIVDHVILEVYIAGEWVPLETTEPVALGWRPPHVKTSMYR